MADWQEIGRRVRDQIFNRPHPLADPLIAIGESPEYELYRAVDRSSRGDPSALAEYLCSKRPLSPADRELLALHELRPRPKEGRPPDEHARAAVYVAKWIFRDWKAENKRARIKDWRLRREMKDQSCRYAIEILKPLMIEVPEFEILREMMEHDVYRS